MSGSAPTSDICLIVRHGSNGPATDLAALPPDLSLPSNDAGHRGIRSAERLGKRVAGFADALKLP